MSDDLDTAAGQPCGRCQEVRRAYERLSREHGRCDTKHCNQQKVVGKLEAAVKLLNKMLYDDKKHRVFLQERLDTAEQALYLRTCLAELQQVPVRAGNKSKSARSTILKDDVEIGVSIRKTSGNLASANEDHHNTLLETEETSSAGAVGLLEIPLRLECRIDSTAAGLSPLTPPRCSRRTALPKVKRDANVAQRQKPSPAVEINGTNHTGAASSKDSEGDAADEVTVNTSDLSSATPSECDLDPDEIEMVLIRDALARGKNKQLDLSGLNHHYPNHPQAAGDFAEDRRRPRKSHASEHSLQFAEPIIPTASGQVFKREKSPSREASLLDDVFLLDDPAKVAKILKTAQTSKYKEWKRQQTNKPEVAVEEANFCPRRFKRLDTTVAEAKTRPRRRTEAVPNKSSDEEGTELSTTRRTFPIARTTKSTLLKDGFTRLKYEHPEQQWVSRAGPARG